MFNLTTDVKELPSYPPYYIDGVAWYGNHELRIIVLDLRLDNLQHSRHKVSLLLFRTREKLL